MRIWQGLIVASALVLAGCGGGGGSSTPSTVTLTGNVLDVVSGNGPNPAASVQVGTTSVFASTVDGSFSIVVPSGSKSMLVTAGTYPVYKFNYPAVVADTNLGDLYVGPTQITVAGSVEKAADSTAVPGATVNFGGQVGLTDTAGKYTLFPVAYAANSTAGFFGIVGTVNAAGYLPATFNASGTIPNSNNLLALSPVLLTPVSDPNPPGVPYDIWGVVGPAANAPGTVVSLVQNGTAIRTATVTGNDQYSFWVLPGTYTLTFVNGKLTASPQSVTVKSSNDVERRDATLH